MEYSVTVFRSADASAEEDANAVLKLLGGEGISGVVMDDSSPGVPAGAWEVRVAPEHRAQAEALVAAHPVENELDESHDLDLVTVFRAAGNTSEMEAMSVKGMLESNGIRAFLVSDARLPNLPDEVRVPREEVTTAKRVIADALAAGPAAAEEAEASGEN